MLNTVDLTELVASEPVQPAPALLWPAFLRDQVYQNNQDALPAAVPLAEAGARLPRRLAPGRALSVTLLASNAASHCRQHAEQSVKEGQRI